MADRYVDSETTHQLLGRLIERTEYLINDIKGFKGELAAQAIRTEARLITLELKSAESLENLQLSRISVNNETVPPDLLSWKYRSKRLGDYLAEYRNGSGVGTMEIRDAKLILKSRTE